MTTTIPLTRQQKQRGERWLLLATVILVVVAWSYGYLTAATNVLPLVADVIPGAVQIQSRGQLFVGLDESGEIVGYAAVGQAPGYAGPIEMLVGVSPTGEILAALVVVQRESPGFFRLVDRSDLVNRYTGRSIKAPLQLGNDLDAVSGATVSA